MRRSLLLAAILAASAAPARAEDPNDLFGLGPSEQPKPAAVPPPCDDGAAVGCVTATDPLADISPASVRTWLTGSYFLLLPVGDARHDAVAHFATGANRDEAGAVFGGASGVENRWTIEGAPADGIRAGAAETSVPLAFVESLVMTAGGFSARDRAGTGGTVDVKLIRGTKTHQVTARVWGEYTSEQTRRPVARLTYNVRRATADVAPSASAAVTATGPLPSLAGGTTWYAAGVAPSLEAAEYTWRAARLVDADADDEVDLAGGDFVTQTIDTSQRTARDYVVPFLARTGWERGAHAVDITLVGQVAGTSLFLGNATIDDTAISRRTTTGDAIATWRGSWASTRARAQLAWHRSARRESPRDSSESSSQFLAAYIPAGTDLAADCAADPDGTGIVPCPVPTGFFATGGAGLLVDQTGDRPSATVDVAHRIDNHVLRAGGTYEDSRLVTESRYTGGAIVRSLFDGHTDTQTFLAGACEDLPGAPCETSGSQELRYRTRYAAAYIEDTFQMTPGIRVDTGLRYEKMKVGSVLDLDQWAPRLSLSGDPFGQGRSRFWVSMGRSYVMIPAGIGATVLARNSFVRDIVSPLGDARIIDPGNVFNVAPGIQPAAQDEITVGAEVGQPGLARAGVWVQGRTLRRGYETVLLDPEELTARFDNPGRDASAAARRDVVVVGADAMITPTPASAVRATYSYTHATGSWAGPFDPRQRANLFAGTDFDLDQQNLFGLLPTDARHRVAVEAARRGHLGSLDVGVALRGSVTSGRPRNALADTDRGLVYLIPRGEAGRGPVITQLNIRLSARWQGFDLTLDAFNVFDRDTPTTVGEIYSGLTARPIAGGSYEDLVFLKLDGGTPAPRRTSYRLPLAYQSPFGVTLGLARTF